MATQIKQKPRRGRGRPRSEDKLLIDSERTQFKLKSRIIEVSWEALDTIHKLMLDKSASAQTRSGNARLILEMAAELHRQLIESEAADTEETVTNVEIPSENEQDNESDGASIIDWGSFKKVEG